MQRQKEFHSEGNPAEAHQMEVDHEPKSLTFWQNVMMTAKVLGAVALLISLVWLVDRLKG
jgi:hypothetical protein